MKHIKTLNTQTLQNTMKKGGADNDFRYLISSGLKVPPPLVILIPYTRWKAHCTPPLIMG